MHDILSGLNQYPLLYAVLIVLARMVDVSLGTMRTITVVRGHRVVAACLGFLEVTIWLTVISSVIGQITWWKVLAYGTGFALGNASGIMLENYLAIGQQLVMLISRHRSHSVAFGLRLSDYLVTELPARGASGRVAMCFTVVPRRRVPEAIRLARRIDEDCLTIVEDVRQTSVNLKTLDTPPTGWRAILKKK